MSRLSRELYHPPAELRRLLPIELPVANLFSDRSVRPSGHHVVPEPGANSLGIVVWHRDRNNFELGLLQHIIASRITFQLCGKGLRRQSVLCRRLEPGDRESPLPNRRATGRSQRRSGEFRVEEPAYFWGLQWR